MNTPNTLRNTISKAGIYFGLFLISQPAMSQHYYPAGLGNANLQLWLTAADPTTILTSAGTPAANGNSVATWTDKSGHGASAVQATVADQPVYQTNQLNGFGGIIFQNTNQYMTGASGAYQTVISTRAMLGAATSTCSRPRPILISASAFTGEPPRSNIRTAPMAMTGTTIPAPLPPNG